MKSRYLGLIFSLLFAISSAGVAAVTWERSVNLDAGWHAPLPAEGSDFLVFPDGRYGVITAIWSVSSGRRVSLILIDPKSGLRERIALENRIFSGAALNSEGVLALSLPHFTKALFFYDKRLNKIGESDGYMGNDAVGWKGPGSVKNGGGVDFYGMDQNAGRILRTQPGDKSTTKVIQSIPLPKGWPTKTDSLTFAVDEARSQYYLTAKGNELLAVDFNGNELWRISMPMAPSSLTRMEDGRLAVFNPSSHSVCFVTSDGQPAGQITLNMGTEPLERAVYSMMSDGKRFYLRRGIQDELLAIFDQSSGDLVQSIRSEKSEIKLEWPSSDFLPGQVVPLKISSSGSQSAPIWSFWAAPVGTALWTRMPFDGTNLTIPENLLGLYQVRLTASLSGDWTAMALQGVVAVKPDQGAQWVTVMTPANRTSFAHGEVVPWELSSPAATKGTLQLRDSKGETVFQQEFALEAGKKVKGDIGTKVTARLAPGRYEFVVAGKGLIGTGQPIQLGVQIPRSNPYSFVNYGDYRQMFPLGEPLEAVGDRAKWWASFMHRTGFNLVGQRIWPAFWSEFSWKAPEKAQIEAWRAAQAKAFSGVAPEKFDFSPLPLQLLADYSRLGVEFFPILLSMDYGFPAAGLPEKNKKTADDEIRRTNDLFKPYPAFQGWVWSANWWVSDTTEKFGKNDEEKLAYTAALAEAKATGGWSPILEELGFRKLNVGPATFADWKRQMEQQIGPKRNTVAGPYRAPQVYPPLTYAEMSEVDMHFQSEQIGALQTYPHAVAFMARPGKKSWIHPELWNDTGNGDYILPLLFQLAMWGVNGVGVGDYPHAQVTPHSDPRSGTGGLTTIYRNLFEMLRAHGPWMSALPLDAPVVIPVSRREILIDDKFGALGGHYFTNLFEAWNASLYAGYPARFVFLEDLKGGQLDPTKIVLLVSQGVELDPEWKAALSQAISKGARVFIDGSCRKPLPVAATELPLTIGRIEKAGHGMNSDFAQKKYDEIFRSQAELLRAAFAPITPPVAEISEPAVLALRRGNRNGSVTFFVNNTLLPLEPGQIRNMATYIGSRFPLMTDVKIPVAEGQVVYDVFLRKKWPHKNGVGRLDLTASPFAALAVLPAEIGSVDMVSKGGGKPGDVITSTVAVRDAKRVPMAATLPVEVTVMDSQGTTLHREAGFSGPAPFASSWTMPANPSLPLQVTATEFVTGQTASIVCNNLKGGFVAGPSPAAPEPIMFGSRLKAAAVSEDGASALVTGFQWGDNSWLLDLKTGKIRKSFGLGNWFAFSPVQAPQGFFVQSYEAGSAEGLFLNKMSAAGTLERRFAAPGIARAQATWAYGIELWDQSVSFAISPDARWVAASGNLGVAVYDVASGALLWKSAATPEALGTPTVIALNATKIAVARSGRIEVLKAKDGTQESSLDLGLGGAVKIMKALPDGSGVAVFTEQEGGRILRIQGGKITATFLQNATDLAPASDSLHLWVLRGSTLSLIHWEEGLRWNYEANDVLWNPSARNSRLAVASQSGTVYQFDLDGQKVFESDFGQLAWPAWTPSGQLLLAGWLGKCQLLGPDGSVEWTTAIPGSISTVDRLTARDRTTATSSDHGWVTAEKTPWPVNEKAIGLNNFIINYEKSDQVVPLLQKLSVLRDKDLMPSSWATPWLAEDSVGYICSGWRSQLELTMIPRKQKVPFIALTLANDPEHPESWIRDGRLQRWDSKSGTWLEVMALRSDSAVATFRFPEPVLADKFRILSSVAPGPWLKGNIRLTEVAFYTQAPATEAAPSASPNP